jgi:primase-polymerase (primpol)-like protein
LSDAEIVLRARRARNGAKFERLYDRGDTAGYASHSEADLALASMLSFWTQDPAQIDRIFASSALVRDKWQRRPDYRQRTTAKALSGSDTYHPPIVPVRRAHRGLGPAREGSVRVG